MQVKKYSELKQLQALVIESTQLYQGIFTHLLEAAGYQVSLVSTGKDAMQLCKKRRFNVICLGMQLSDAEGTQLCAKLRVLSTTMNVPIIMLDSHENNEQMQRAMVSGATEVFHTSEIKEFSIYLQDLAEKFNQDQMYFGRILFIEDQSAVAIQTKTFLESVGYEVDHFNNAEDAFNELLRTRYDLVLTDIVLGSKKTGTTLIREIQKLPGRYAEIPILAISSISDVTRKVEILNSGASDFIQKPVLDEELLARVNNLVRMRRLLDEVELQRSEMRDLAMHDQLTKLYNRHYLMDHGPKKISEAIRHNIPVSLLVIDLDYFKSINDTYGHKMGDTVLENIAKTLIELSRHEDMCARFGGEEFIMLLGYCDRRSAMNKAELIRIAIESLKIDGIRVTTSIGVAAIDENTQADFDTMFEAADRAVYRAKELGRNRVEFEDLE